METPQEKQLYPWGSLWTKPRKTIRAQIERDPHKTVLWLAVCQGIVSSFYWIDAVQAEYPGLHIGLVYILTILGAIATSIGTFYLMSWVYKFCGHWIGGKGHYTEVKCAVGWSYYPSIVAGLLGLASYYVAFAPGLQKALGLGSSIAFIWGLIILIKTVAESHRFGAWRGVATIVLGAIVVGFALFIITFAVGILKGVIPGLS
ncbi:MAG: hypothetical protein S4CHLAM45_06460 [Chlamydiales bacterium]|nr:hypothetical protein [Chlamydiales bacterium]MCH9619814.1 hypothetical protein [Chlamydiales bacterium]MCH9622759.1 hypothetical protein [Chlamydiales bacterium]